MVFSSYNSTSYLPLDNDQSVTFYKNENRLFPTAVVPPTAVVALPTSAPAVGNPSAATSLSHMGSMSTTDMLTAAYEEQQQQQLHQQLIGGFGSGSLSTGDCPFGQVQSPVRATPHQPPPPQQPLRAIAMCDDFQPVAYLNGSSNGYYGYVPSLAPVGSIGGHPNINNNYLGAGTANHLSLDPAAGTTLAPNHSSLGHYHGNAATPSQHQHRGGQDSEQNNNNEGLFGEREPLSVGLLQHHRKRKEMGDASANHNRQQDDEEMDTNEHQTAFEHHPKRRRTEPEQASTGQLVETNFCYIGGPHHEQPQHRQPLFEMARQDQTHHSLPAQPSREEYMSAFQSQDIPAPADGHHHPTSKIQTTNEPAPNISSKPTPETQLRLACTPKVSALHGGLFARFPVGLNWPPSEFANGGADARVGVQVGNHYDLELFHSLHGTGGGFR